MPTLRSALPFLMMLACAESYAASMQFFGTSNFASSEASGDRVRFLIQRANAMAPVPTANIGVTDTTVDFWLKGAASDNATGNPDCTGGSGWIGGHIVIDQDVAGKSNQGIPAASWGISLNGQRLAYGVRGRFDAGITLCANINVVNGQWRHVAFQRRVSDGRLWIFVDGQLVASAIGSSGDKSYPQDLQTTRPNSDPYTVLGAEKLGFFTWTNYKGLISELRFSTVLRYGTGTTLGPVFTRPSARNISDASTASLWRFTEGTGALVNDTAGNSPGQVRFTTAGDMPAWSLDSPFVSDSFLSSGFE